MQFRQSCSKSIILSITIPQSVAQGDDTTYLYGMGAWSASLAFTGVRQKISSRSFSSILKHEKKFLSLFFKPAILPVLGRLRHCSCCPEELLLAMIMLVLPQADFSKRWSEVIELLCIIKHRFLPRITMLCIYNQSITVYFISARFTSYLVAFTNCDDVVQKFTLYHLDLGLPASTAYTVSRKLSDGWKRISNSMQFEEFPILGVLVKIFEK